MLNMLSRHKIVYSTMHTMVCLPCHANYHLTHKCMSMSMSQVIIYIMPANGPSSPYLDKAQGGKRWQSIEWYASCC